MTGWEDVAEAMRGRAGIGPREDGHEGFGDVHTLSRIWQCKPADARRCPFGVVSQLGPQLGRQTEAEGASPSSLWDRATPGRA